MADSFTTIDKNSIIEAFNKNEIMILKAISDYEKTGDKSKLDRDFAIASQLLTSFAKNLTEKLSGVYVAEKYIEPYIYCDEAFEVRMQVLLKKIIQNLVTVMSYMGDITEKGYDEEKAIAIRGILGDISLVLRFDIVSMPQGTIDDRTDIGNVYFKLGKINSFNKDHFLVKNLWQSSTRRILPNFTDFNNVAIVMQGPIDYDYDFTLETLLRYKRLYPDVIIVLSTWENEVKEEFALIAEAAGIIIHENEKPLEGGPWNLRYQLKSTLGGISRAQECADVEFVLKTRTDQAFFLAEFIPYFVNMLRTFPVNCADMKSRIVFLGGYGTMCTSPFRITDFLSFGTIQDITNFYSAPENFERLEYTYYDGNIKQKVYYEVLQKGFDDNYVKMCSMGEQERRQIVDGIGRMQDPESYMVQSFCERVVYKKEITTDDDVLLLYWKFVKNCAIFLDAEELMLFWDKYSYKFLDLGGNMVDGGLTHATWLSIYYSDF